MKSTNFTRGDSEVLEYQDTTTDAYALEELSEGFIYVIGIPSVSSFGEHVSTGACG